ncbi:MAG: glycine cleavage system aminomethyltransferase GcvT [Dehalococcoidia bacterium]|nr:glycine cleavage system aminomethyltransferase GcvT [Dehalococcoidia bacterium]
MADTPRGAGEPLVRLPLHDRHLAAGARMAPFAGWEMPLQYAGILAEHEAVRSHAGLFDVSHMGRVRVRGDDAAARIRRATSYDVRREPPGGAHYALYCTEGGGIADDIMVYRIDHARWLVVHNAANAAAGYERLRAVAGDAAEEVTRDTVMLAIQGPRAIVAVRHVLGGAIDALATRTCAEVAWQGGTVFVARTGYTGEDGMECIADRERGAALWDSFVAAGVPPVGLGARDTLRLEAALPLHGHDITADTNPYEAGLGWAVTLDDGEPFTGRPALQRLAATAAERRLGHLRLTGRGVPRAGYAVLDPSTGGRAIATLTSGAYSPTLRAGIGMGYLPRHRAAVGTALAIEIRGQRVAAEVVPRPFYRRPQ